MSVFFFLFLVESKDEDETKKKKKQMNSVHIEKEGTLKRRNKKRKKHEGKRMPSISFCLLHILYIYIILTIGSSCELL